MPVDFGPGSPADLDLGTGPHFPQIRFTADDESCVWNDFPVYIGYRLFGFVSGDPSPLVGNTQQLVTFTTPSNFAGTYEPSEAEWPSMRFYNVRRATLSGLDLVSFRIRFNASGSTSVGSYGFRNNGSLICGGTAGPIVGDYDSGTVSVVGSACLDCSMLDDAAIHPVFTNFSPITGGVTIQRGKLTFTWGSDPLTTALYNPDQPFNIFFSPPCHPHGANLSICPSASATSPPTPDWENSVIPGDAGMESRSSTECEVGSNTSGRGTMWWEAETFPPEQWVHVFAFPHPGGTNALYCFLRLTNPGTASVCGYMLEGTETTAKVYRIDNAALTLLATFPLTAPQAEAMGYRFFISGSNIGVQGNLDTNYYGNEFPFIGSTTDSTYSTGGFVGVGVSGLTGRLRVVAGGASGLDDPGLFINLETNSCGVLTKTYDEIVNEVNALNCGITATVQGGHNADIAQISAGALDGAICAGALDNPYTG